jgi:hypothetical protein
MTSYFARVPVTVGLGLHDTTIEYDPTEVGPGDQWAFQKLHIYLIGLPPNSCVGQPNECIMKMTQFNWRTNKLRHIRFILEKLGGCIAGISIQITDGCAPQNTVRVLQVPQFVHKVRDKTTGKIKGHRISFHHWQLLGVLQDHQEILLSGTAGNVVQFYLNFIGHFEDMCVVPEGGAVTLMSGLMMSSTWTPDI